MSNHFKFCSCPYCRRGMHSKYGSKSMKKLIRKVRRLAKQQLKQGEEPEPKHSAGYTD